MKTYTATAIIASADIHLTNITMESYNKILDFIDRLDENDSKPVESKPAKKSKKTTDVNTIRVNNRVATVDPSDPWSAVGNYKGKDALIAYFKAAQDHPDQYDIRFATAQDLHESAAELNEITIRSTAFMLGELAKIGSIERRESKTKYGQPRPEFMVPVKKPLRTPVKAAEDTPVTINPVDKERGNKLRSARIAKGFSILELGTMIGYEPNIIQKWETGQYSMSSGAINQINSAFGSTVIPA